MLKRGDRVYLIEVITQIKRWYCAHLHSLTVYNAVVELLGMRFTGKKKKPSLKPKKVQTCRLNQKMCRAITYMDLFGVRKSRKINSKKPAIVFEYLIFLFTLKYTLQGSNTIKQCSGLSISTIIIHEVHDLYDT